MILIQNLHFFSLLLYSYMAGYILYKDHKSLLNISCAVLISSFAFWNIVDVFATSTEISIDTLTFLQNISSIGWISFASIFLCFSLIFSKKEKLLKKKWLIFLIFFMPLIFIYQQWANRLTGHPVQGKYGWEFNWEETVWSYLYYAYYISFTFLTIYIVCQFGIKSKNTIEKSQAKIIVTTVLIGLIGGTITDVILPLFNIHEIPQIANLILMIFSGGLIYAVVKYKFLIVTPAIAAENIISIMEELLILSDKEGNILNVNNAVTETLKYNQNELIGKPIEILFIKGIVKNSLLERITKGEVIKNHEIGLITKDTIEIPVIISCSFLKDKEGEINGIVVIARDITEHINAEKALFEGQQVFRSLVENSPDIIARYDINCQRTYVNPEYLKTAQISQQELITTSPIQLSPLPENSAKTLQSLLCKVLNTGTVEAVNLIWPKADGIEYWYNVYAFPEFGREGNVVSVMTISRDITKSKQSENELLKAKEKAEESDRLKSAFLANLSHEIRTPMNGILGFAGLLKERHLTGEKQQEYISIIEQSGQRMLNIISDIVNISKIESGQIEVHISETDVNSQMEYLYSFFKPEVEQKRIRFSLMNELSSKSEIVFTDKEKLTAIMLNLIKNAIKFTDHGFIEFGYNITENYLEFFVRDSGVGIHSSQHEIIFERFRQGSESLTRKYEGTGLGLSISKAFVEILGGKIWLNSELGKGSVFYFTIPRNPKEV